MDQDSGHSLLWVVCLGSQKAEIQVPAGLCCLPEPRVLFHGVRVIGRISSLVVGLRSSFRHRCPLRPVLDSQRPPQCLTLACLTMTAYIGLIIKFIWVFYKDVMKNSKEFFCQPNTFKASRRLSLTSRLF